MQIKPGSRWRSAVSDTEVIAVKAPGTPVTLQCGGHEMIPQSESRPTGGEPDAALSEDTLLGKRYADEAIGMELLCTKAGKGTLAVDGMVLTRKDAKPLPASD